MKNHIFPSICCCLGLLMVSGCQSIPHHKPVRASGNFVFEEELLEVVTPAFFELPEDRAQASIAYIAREAADQNLNSKNANAQIAAVERHAFYSAFFTVLSLPIVEKPEYWIRGANNAERSDLYRLYCFRAFFLRHVKEGTRLDSLAKAAGTDAWFGVDTVSLVGGLGGGSVFEPEEGQDEIEIRLRVPIAEASTPVTLAVKGIKMAFPYGYTEKNKFVLDLLLGLKGDPNVNVTGVGVF